MTGVDSYSTTPLENETVDGTVTWKEGQLPSTVNNGERQMLTDLRERFNDLPWFQYGHGTQDTSTHLAKPCVYVSGTSFSVTGGLNSGDHTAYYHAGRPVRAVGTLTGTIYGYVSSSSYNAGLTKTTVVVVWLSGSLTNETLVISMGLPVLGVPGTGITITFDIVVKAGDDSGDAVHAAVVDDIRPDFAFTITGWTVSNNASGSITWDIRKNTFTVDDPPDSGESIVASAPPNTASHQSATSTTLTAWATAVAAGDALRFVLSAVDSVVKRSSLTLKCSRTLAP